jgi:hypothetical protein
MLVAYELATWNSIEQSLLQSDMGPYRQALHIFGFAAGIGGAALAVFLFQLGEIIRAALASAKNKRQKRCG